MYINIRIKSLMSNIVVSRAALEFLIIQMTDIRCYTLRVIMQYCGFEANMRNCFQNT